MLCINGKHFFEWAKTTDAPLESKLLNAKFARRAPPNTDLGLRCQICAEHHRVELYRRGRLCDRRTAIDRKISRDRLFRILRNVYRYTRTRNIAVIVEVKHRKGVAHCV